MNYILLNNIIFNHENLRDKMDLKGAALTEKILTSNHSCYCDDDYSNLITEIYGFLSDKTNVTLVVGTFFYKLPCFVELLSEKLKNVRIVPLILFFCENNNAIVENEEFVVNEVYNRFVIKTTCKVANKTWTIVSLNLEQFDFEKELLNKIEWTKQNHSIEEKRRCINIDKVSSLNKISKTATEKEDFSDHNCYESIVVADFTLLQFYQNIIESLKRFIVCNKKRQLIFNTLLYLNKIEKYIDNWDANWSNLSVKQTDYKNDLKIKEACFEIQTLPDNRNFTSNDKFWLLAESADFACLFSCKNDGMTKTGKFSIPSKYLSNIAFFVNKKSVVKLFLEIEKDVFNNLNVIFNIDNALFYNKINFQYE